MLQAFQYKLYPSQKQECRLFALLEMLRHLYNNALAERIDAYKYEGRSIEYVEQAKHLPALKAFATPLEECYSQVAQNCLKRLDIAYQNFFRRVKQGQEKLGFPRYKGVGRYRSFTYPQWGTAANIKSATNKGNLLHLSKIGDIAVCLHRPLQGTPKTCTITHKADGWYACIVCEVEPEPLPKTGKKVGIDVGLENFATFSDDTLPVANPKPLQQAQASLRKSQQRLERRTRRDKKGKLLPRQSRRRDKAKVLLAKAHQRVARARLDFHHKVANRLVHQFDTLYVENLHIQGMLQNHCLAKAIVDAGWGQFFVVLNHQAAKAAKQVVEVCPNYTSQNCCGCGNYVPKALSCRLHSCPYCGLVLHRDVNAARNIHKKGTASLCEKNGGDAAFSERLASAVL